LPQSTNRIRIGRALDDPAAKRALNERLFTTIAGEYPWMTAALSLGRDAAWKRRLVRSLPDAARPVCLDLACGTGDLTRLLARRFPDGRVLGQDLTAAMLDEAKRRTAEPNVQYEQCDIAATGLGDGSVDIVTGGYALRNAPALDDALAEVARVLRPGGTAAFLDFRRAPGRVGGWAARTVLRLWGGFWGLLLHRNPAVYGYIAASLRTFPTLPDLRERFRAHGLPVTETTPCFFGFTAIIVARREPPPETAA
jgi:demethylmenaquinone methyltransferase/2-methoxy-6-polyprenyl-1,4-benzoquinol methylase